MPSDVNASSSAAVSVRAWRRRRRRPFLDFQGSLFMTPDICNRVVAPINVIVNWPAAREEGAPSLVSRIDRRII